MHNPLYKPSLSFFDDTNSLAYQLWKKNIPLKRASDHRIFESVLFKQSKRQNFLKSRYYVLFEDRLAYFKNGREFKESGYCLLLNVKLEIISIEDGNEEKSRYGFRLVHNGQYCELFARGKDIQERWIKVLSKYCVLSWYSTLYNDLKTIGKGSFAKVYLSKRKSDGAEFAVKTFNKSLLLSKEKARASLINEITIMRRLQHEGIITLEEVHESKDHIHLVLEVLHGGELFERIIKKGFYSERDACILMQKLLRALEYMHSKGIMHRDIKPENLILKDTANDWNVKIADFGLAAFVHSNEFLFRRCGTPGYVAPEVLDDLKYDQKVDVFSAGVILYILLTGRSPFPGYSYNELLKKNKNCEINFNFKEMNVRISDLAIDLMRKMLRKNPAARCSASEALKHEWFLNGGDFLSPRTKTPISLNSAVENMKRFQQEDRFNVKNIKPKDLDRPSLEKSGHAPSPLITGKLSVIIDTKNSLMGSPRDMMKSPRERLPFQEEKIMENSDENEKSFDDSGSEDVSNENNTVKTDMRKYNNLIVFPGLSRYTNPSKQGATTYTPPVNNTNFSQKPLQKAKDVRENLLKFTKMTTTTPSTQGPSTTSFTPIWNETPLGNFNQNQDQNPKQNFNQNFQQIFNYNISQNLNNNMNYNLSHRNFQVPHTIPIASPVLTGIHQPNPIQMQDLSQKGSQGSLLEGNSESRKMNLSINTRQQRKREPLMNFLKPFQ